MPKVTYPQIMQIITKNNKLFIPDIIEDLVIKCMSEDISLIKQTGDEIKKSFNVYNQAVTIDYDRQEIVDAYSLYYMRRNSLIPRIAVRDIVTNQGLQLFPDKMKILDLGSGTGAVTLGLLEMFLHSPLNTIDIEVHALDNSLSCLNRLQEYIDKSDLSRFHVYTKQLDLYDISSLEEYMSNTQPYDIIFAANIFNELEHSQSCSIINILSRYLNSRAFIVIVNAQRDFIKRLQPLLVREANNLGLFLYYPCPSYDLSNHQCWFWREHDYECRTLRTRTGQFILSSHREQLVAHWLILGNQQFTIYDDFKVSYPSLEWGVFNIFGKDARLSDCEICTGRGKRQLGRQDKAYKRGAIVGFTDNPLTIQQYFEL